MAVQLALFRTFQHALLNVLHRQVHATMVFLRSQQLQIPLGRDFQVHAHTVGIQPRLVHQFLTGTGNTLQVDIAVETVLHPQVFRHPHQPLHRIIGIAHHA